MRLRSSFLLRWSGKELAMSDEMEEERKEVGEEKDKTMARESRCSAASVQPPGRKRHDEKWSGQSTQSRPSLTTSPKSGRRSG